MSISTSFPAGNGPITPRIIIHGGAGNITRTTIPLEKYEAYRTSLRRILSSSAALLSQPGSTALDVATHAVSLLEDDPLYNSAHGAVFTRDGKIELETSIMVSNGYRKRSVGCMMLSHVKNPVKLAREILVRGEEADGGGAKDHCQYSGAYVEKLAKRWGLDIVDEDYFWTKEKWEQHKRGLKDETSKRFKVGRNSNQSNVSETDVIPIDEMSEWERTHYIPLGTCGAVVLDSFGTICAATSTGGLMNKIPGRIGDTPTVGAGYWAEEWFEEAASRTQMLYRPTVSHSPLDRLSRGDIRSLVGDCLPLLSQSSHAPSHIDSSHSRDEKPSTVRHAVGMSSSGNGDTFVRLAAARTVAARSRFALTPLSSALSWMTGPGGELQRSAGDRWGRVHEGVGGMIGIELVDEQATVICDYNCGGMFRAWTEENGTQKCLIFREDDYESGPP